jgi:hypothetical protein
VEIKISNFDDHVNVIMLLLLLSIRIFSHWQRCLLLLCVDIIPWPYPTQEMILQHLFVCGLYKIGHHSRVYKKVLWTISKLHLKHEF